MDVHTCMYILYVIHTNIAYTYMVQPSLRLSGWGDQIEISIENIYIYISVYVYEGPCRQRLILFFFNVLISQEYLKYIAASCLTWTDWS